MPSAKELRELAIKSAQKEFEEVIEQLTVVARQGKFQKNFPNLSDGARQLLISEGYKVELAGHTANGQIYRVSF